ncbi:hypothetical protein NH340_JMT08389 [Sarcoptes scabiei]|nr:hypothetical protein NH340_JMT08389 [Sarcoptes scabiei]
MIHFLQNYPKIILFLKLFLFFTLSFNSIIDADNYLKQQNFSETNFSTQESHRSRSDLSNDSEKLNELKRKLFAQYDRMARPVLNLTRPINVQMFIRLLYFRLDFEKDSFEFNAIFRFQWIDEFLQWNPSEFNQIERFNIGLEKVFTPDIVLFNSIDQNNLLKRYNQTELTITSDGFVIWRPIVKLRSICNLNLSDWPNDRQQCSLIFLSWSYPGDALALYIASNHIELDALESNGNQWRVLRTDCVTEIFIPDCCPELFIPQVRFTIEMIRKKSLEIYLIHLPILCSILFNLFSITLDPYRNRYVRFFLNRIAFIVLLIILLYLMNRFGEATFARTNLAKILALLLINVSGQIIWSSIANALIQSESSRTVEFLMGHLSAKFRDFIANRILTDPLKEICNKNNYLFVSLIDYSLLIVLFPIYGIIVAIFFLT